MINNILKIMLIVAILFILFPMNFAADTEKVENQTDSNVNIYFNSSSQNDGDGSKLNPYKYLTSERIKENSNIRLSEGEYYLDCPKNIKNIKIQGQYFEKTIIHYEGVAFNVLNSLFVENITLKGVVINNTSKLTVKNTVFDGGCGVLSDSYANLCGGAIYTPKGYVNANVNVINSTFINSHAEYGGAIYMDGGVLNIENTLFKNVYSYNFGGSIACENTRLIISKSKFENSSSLNDAGGSIYIKSSTLMASNLNFSNSAALFGGAITSLKSTLSIQYCDFSNNEATFDGGAVYQIYGTCFILNSNFFKNNAKNGAAIYINNLSYFNIDSNIFSHNGNLNANGVIYSFDNLSHKSNLFSRNFCENIFKADLNLTIISQNYTLIKSNHTLIELPHHYSLVDENQITSVKNQGSTGNCWAFSAISVLESCILKATGKYLDLSEENLKNLMALYSNYGWNLECNGGGYYNMPIGYFASWMGPVYESDDLFDDKSALSPILESIYHIQNILFLNDIDEIKEAIIRYGAVGAGMAYYDNFFNNITNSYFCFLNRPVNHAVCIVGWDDNYSKSNFKYSTYLKNDGAWICKNSWGFNWADEGYFYVSYDDMKFAKDNPSYTVIFNDTLKYDKNYQYDIQGMTDYFRNISRKVWYKNIFTSTDNEYLAGVSTYFEQITNWTLTVLVNGQLKLIKNGISNPGYYTIKLDSLIPLNKDDVFEVMFNISVAKKASFPVSEISHLNKLTYTSGISYVSYDNRHWMDLNNLTFSFLNHNYTSQVACIKAFTILNPININLSYYIDNGTLIIDVFDEFGNSVDVGSVSVNVGGKIHIINVLNYQAILTVGDEDIYWIFYESDGYKSSKINISKNSNLKINYNVTQNNICVNIENNYLNETFFITINNKTFNIQDTLNFENLDNAVYYINITSLNHEVLDFKSFEINCTKTEITIINNKIILKDSFGNLLNNKSLKVILNNITYNLTTDINSSVYYIIDCDSIVNVVFNGEDNYFKSNISKEIKFLDISINHTIYEDFTIIYFNLSKSIDESFMVKINNETDNISFLKGESFLKLFNLGSSVYNISVLCNDADYILNNSYYSFIQDFKQTHFVLNELNPKHNTSFNLTLKLVDDDFNPIGNVYVDILLENKSYFLKTSDDGYVNVNVTLANGEYDINAYFNGSDKYFKTSKNFKINVTDKKKKQTKIIAYNLTTYYKSNALFLITLMDIDGVKLKGEIIQFILNNKTYLKTTDDEGSAFINVNLKTGFYQVNITYEGCEDYASSSFKLNINVTSSIIALIDNKIAYNSNYCVKLLDNNGNPLVNSQVLFILNNQQYLKTTDFNGNAYLTIKNNPNNYSLKIINIKNGEEIVKDFHLVSRIVSSDASVYEGDYYRFFVFDDKGKGKANALVNVNINGVRYKVKTDNNGQARFKINLAKGKYNLALEYKGFKSYNKILVKPILSAKNISIKKAKVYKLSAKLTNALKGKKIIFKIKNKNFSAKTNKRGVAVVNVKLKLNKGVYKINAFYLNFKITFKLKIK